MSKVRSKSKTAKVEVDHFNTKVDDKALEAIATGHLTGSSEEELASELGINRVTINRKYREIELPTWYPEASEVDQTIKDLYEIVILKALHRLALNGIAEMDLKTIPVTLGICTDKRQMLNGQPTSMSLQVHTSMNHSDIAKRIQESKASKSQVVDAQVIVDDKKQT